MAGPERQLSKWLDEAVPEMPRRKSVSDDHHITAVELDDPFGEIHGAIMMLYRTILRVPVWSTPSTKSLGRQLESSQNSLLIWSDDYGVRDGSLGRVLKTSQDLRRSAIKILISISTGLARGISHTGLRRKSEAVHKSAKTLCSLANHLSYVFLDEDDDDSDTNSVLESDDSDSLESILEDIQFDTEYLFDLGPRLEEPIP
ncbi:hypothetical protein B0T17DRAFT_233378 [Bombardia bombarda]|uniref:Uncharacterized protein n=1 Tax=Bombardia bombarda TaxID=252184 RepID=A0AA40CA81_9PEZI|nr:hypothetical protein B0T17DRAFT_233378 [Bombardia bombarda]